MAVRTASSDALRQFFTEGTALTYAKGEFIIRPEDQPSGVFYIESGFVKSVSATKYGEENLLVIRKPGEVFPLIWRLTGDNSNIGYEAHTSVTVRRRSHEDLDQALQSSQELLCAMLEITTVMYQTQAERVSSLVYRTVRERMAYFLCAMAQRFGVPHPDGVMIDIPLTRNELASSISATRETISREFSTLARKGIVAQKDGRIVITDKDRLKQLL